MPKAKERIRILSDDDGHTFFVPESIAPGFAYWVEAMESDGDAEEYDGIDYSQYEVNCHLSNYTFLDPQESLL